MSYIFDPFTNPYFSGPPVPFTYPLVFTCWVKPDPVSGYGDCMSTGRWDQNDHRLTLGLLSSGQSLVIARDGSGQSAALTTAPAVDGWSQITARFATTVVRRIYLNGGAEANSSNPRTPTTPDVFIIGKSTRVAVPSFRGIIAHPSVWTYTDNDDWLDLLAQLQNTKPQAITAGTLMHYWPDFETDLVGGLNLTPTNNPTPSEDEPWLFNSPPCDACCPPTCETRGWASWSQSWA